MQVSIRVFYPRVLFYQHIPTYIVFDMQCYMFSTWSATCIPQKNYDLTVYQSHDMPEGPIPDYF